MQKIFSYFQRLLFKAVAGLIFFARIAANVLRVNDAAKRCAGAHRVRVRSFYHSTNRDARAGARRPSRYSGAAFYALLDAVPRSSPRPAYFKQLIHLAL